MVERRIRAARFPAVKSLETFDFAAIPSPNKTHVLELARYDYIKEIHRLGKSDTDKPHVALGLGLTARHEGLSVGFATAAAFVHELMGVRDEKRLTAFRLLIIDVLGFVPLSKVGTELLLEVFNQRYK